MQSIITYLQKTNVVERIILLCLLFFIPGIFMPYWVVEWFNMPSEIHEFFTKPWTIITYGFTHIYFLHILSNLIVLYYFGNVFIDFFNTRQFLIYYFLGIIAGGISYLLFYRFTPHLESQHLIGASAGVTSVFIGLAAKVPHYTFRFRFIGFVEIWILALIWIVLSVLGTGGVDAGAAVAHLGGGLMGYILTFLGGHIALNTFKFNKSNSKKSFKKVYSQPNGIKTQPGYRKKKEIQEQINLILEKISKSGYNSLTQEEKEFLFNQKES
ncbi:MAG: rhomboid family intramembrane serine protease [Flavobacteriaceae bacterium]|nr:rhomboid family intramembrane serine protease [Flavobacteriaceae bacterium]